MNNMKKLASLLLALVMVLAMAVPAMADGETETPTTTYTITIPNAADGHTYEAYQVFVGDLHITTDEQNNTTKVLSNVQWGVNAKNTGAVAEGDMTGLTVGKVAGYVNFDSTPVATSTDAGDTYTITGLVAGYYLIKDKDGSLDGKDDAYTSYILEVVEDSTVNPKSDKPSVEKKVDDKNDSNNTEDEVVWNDSADHDIGDAVPFQLKATLADNVEDYLKYEIIFHDTLSKGLTYNVGSAKVYLGEDENRVDVTEYFGINAGTYSETTGTEITVSCENVKEFGATNNSVIVVEYTAELNTNANIGEAGNPNKVYLEYSNNPNWGWDIWEDDDNDGKWDEGETDDDDDGDDEDDDHGQTPEDKVIVFTYQTIVNKVDANGNPLTGAEFVLEKFIPLTNGNAELNGVKGEWAVLTFVKNDDGTIFTFKGLDDGEYRIRETVTPSGYNTVEDIYFTVTAEHEILSDNPTLESLTVISNADRESTNEETGEVQVVYAFTTDLTAGSMSTDVINESGAQLPETGGMGTTVIYVIGCLLVAGAAIMLFAKKRAAK